MTSEPESLILRQLGSMDAKLDRIGADVGDLKVCVTAVEEGPSGVHRRLDRIEQRPERLEKRLDLVTP
jgi:archaellum component FlaC